MIDITNLVNDKDKEFTYKLNPELDKELILGIKIPVLRQISKKATIEDKDEFIKSLPHKYLEENILHAIIISEEKNINILYDKIDAFLPYLMSWSDCDVLKPILFKKIKTDMIHNKLLSYLKSNNTFTCRFGIVSLLNFYIDEKYMLDDINTLKNINSDEYYVNMAISWYLSYALIYDFSKVIKYFENHEFTTWIHNKSLQKACESFRIKEDEKEYMRSLKLKL